MWSLFYRNPRLLILTLLLMVAAGLSAFLTMPRKEDPTLTQRFGLVLTRFDGAGAGEVESLVTDPLEEGLREIEEVHEILSTSRYGISVVDVELNERVSDVDSVWSEVRSKLSEIAKELPRGAGEPRLDLKSTEVDAYSLIFALVWERGGDPPMSIIGRKAEELATLLVNLPGTKQTSIFGLETEEVLVEISSEKLAAMGLTPGQVASILEASDARLPAGRVLLGETETRVDVGGEFETLDRIRRVPLGRGLRGEVVLLEHVADILKTTADPPREMVLVDGRQAITVSTMARPDYRIDRWANSVYQGLESFRRQLPAGIEIRTLFDQSRYVETRLSHLLSNLALGGLLVALITVLLMGWRSALMVALSLPLVCLAVFAGLNLLGVPLQQMSVTGLVIALGLMIDNAIIVVDEVKGRLRQGEAAPVAVASGARFLVLPLAGSTLTTVLAFAPLFLMPGPAGEFVGAIGISVVLALGASLGVSLTIVASVAGWFLPANGADRFLENGISSRQLTAWYEGTLDFLLARPWAAVAASLALPAAGFLLASQLDEEFFPAADRREFQVQLKLPPQSSIERTREAALLAHDLLDRNPDIEYSHWFVGGNAPKFYYNMIGGQNSDGTFAQGLLRLAAGQPNPEEVIGSVQRELQSALPEAQVLTLQFGQGPPVSAPVEFHLYGPDLDELRILGERLQAVLGRHPSVISARTSLGGVQPLLRFAIDHDEARLAGLEPELVSTHLSSLLDGVSGGALVEGTERLPVRVRLSKTDRGRLEKLRSLEMARSPEAPSSETPAWLSLSALGSFELGGENSSIRRRDGRRSNSVQGFVLPGVLPAKVLQETLAEAAPLLENLPPGYSFEIGGDSGERNEAVGKLLASAGVLMVLLIATLVLTFNSFRLAGSIVLVAFSSVGLSLLALWLFGHPFGFMAIVGAMGLIGVAVNDAIVVLAGIREANCGGDRLAVRRSVVHSTRHVLATTVTTMVGFLPLLIDGGRFWPPLATSIAGGIAGATVLSLVMIPSLYLSLRSGSAVLEGAPGRPEGPDEAAIPAI